MGFQREISAGVGTDGHGDPGALPAGDDDVGGVGDQAQQCTARVADGDHTDVLDALSPGRGHLTGQGQCGAQRIVPGCGISRHGDGDVVLAVSAGGQCEGNLIAARVPAVRVAHPHRPGQRGVAAVTGHGQPQVHRLAGGGSERLGVQMGDGRQSAQRRGAAVVQPVARVQRLGGLGVGSQCHPA